MPRQELLEAERVHSIVSALFEVYNYFGGGGMCEAPTSARSRTS
jgi:hypothetical protein